MNEKSYVRQKETEPSQINQTNQQIKDCDSGDCSAASSPYPNPRQQLTEGINRCYDMARHLQIILAMLPTIMTEQQNRALSELIKRITER